MPQFKADIAGNINFTPEEVGYLSLKGVKSDCNSLEFVSDLPAMNRIPTGNINFKNTTRSYATNIRIWRSGEFELSEEPYADFGGTLDTNDEISCLVREGTYDFVYELVNGDTGESKGLFAVKDITLAAGSELDISTLNGKRVQ